MGLLFPTISNYGKVSQSRTVDEKFVFMYKFMPSKLMLTVLLKDWEGYNLC